MPVSPSVPLSVALSFAAALAMPASVQAQLGGFAGPPPVKKEATRYDAIVKVVTATIAPQSWDQVGGPGSIQVLDHLGLLVVSQTGEVHGQIEALLGTVRKARQLQSPETGPVNETGPVTETGSIPGAKPAAERGTASLPIHANTKMGAKIESALASETALSFAEEPLQDVISFLTETHQVPVVIDVRALEEVGIGADTPVTADLRGISLRSAMRLILRPLELTYVIRDEVLSITTSEEAEAMLVTRIYPVKDLGTAIDSGQRAAAER